MMVYSGGIYPLPESVFVIAVYGVLLAATTRSTRPVLVGLGCGAFAFGLVGAQAPADDRGHAALPAAHRLARDGGPAAGSSTSSRRRTRTRRVATRASAPTAGTSGGCTSDGSSSSILIAGVPRRARAARVTAQVDRLLCFVLGLGAFDPHAPWTLLHKLPVFSTQHVPSRWMYPGLLLLIAVAGAAFDRVMRRTGWARAWLEIAALAGVAWIARDVGTSRVSPSRHIFYEPMPHVADSTGPFHTEEHLPSSLGTQMRLVAAVAARGDGEHRDDRLRHVPAVPQLLAAPNGMPAPGHGRAEHRRQGLPGRGVHRGGHRQREHRRSGRRTR